MTLRILRAGLLALAALSLPAALAAQQASPVPAAPAQPSAEQIQGWLQELQQIHLRLEALQQQALADPTLSEAQQNLGASVKAAMERIDPKLEESIARVSELETQAAAAQQSGDEAKLEALRAEAMQIQQRFVTAQQRALQQPELAAQVEAFQDQLEAKMTGIDPEAAKLIARFRELEEKLAAAVGGSEG